jgi:hypothetical protein
VAAGAGPGRAPHFGIADIRKSLEGTAAAGSIMPGAVPAVGGVPPKSKFQRLN